MGEKVPMKQHCPHPDLLQVEPFDAIIDEELEPGDILYIPPGFPRRLFTGERAQLFVGFRAPNGRELISGFADYMLAHELGSYRFSDPDGRRAIVLRRFCRRKLKDPQGDAGCD